MGTSSKYTNEVLEGKIGRKMALETAKDEHAGHEFVNSSISCVSGVFQVTFTGCNFVLLNLQMTWIELESGPGFTMSPACHFATGTKYINHSVWKCLS